MANLILKYFLNDWNFINVISKSDFVDWHVLRETDMRLICLFLEWFTRHDYCMVDYMDHDFSLRHSGYRIVTGYRWQVVALSLKVRKLAQGLASALYPVLEGSTRVFVIWALWDFEVFLWFVYNILMTKLFYYYFGKSYFWFTNHTWILKWLKWFSKWVFIFLLGVSSTCFSKISF